MISCVQRREERSRSLASLATAGVHPTVVESPCDPPCRQENRRVGLEALALTGGAGVLFCEDDIRASARLPAFLALARLHDVVTVMCSLRDACLHPRTRAEIRLGQPLRPRIERGTADRWYGTQCVFIPERVAQLVLTSPLRDRMRPDGTWDGFDFLLRDVLLSSGEPLYFALPNPVQHTAPPSVVAGKGQARVSTTYHLRADRLTRLAQLEGGDGW